MNILILENSKLFQLLLEEFFIEQGHSVEIVDTGKAGLLLLESKEFELICASLHLKDCTGIEFTKQYKQQKKEKHSPIILITSETNDTVLKESMEAGITEICLKDNVDKLYSRISLFIESFKSSDAFDITAGKILYIEDSNTVTMITMEFLKDLNLQNIDHYKSADEAYQALQTNTYDLIITDIVVEGQMSVLTLIRELRLTDNDNKHVPILAVTGFDDVSRKIELFKVGVSDYITKPFLEEEFCARVTNLLTNKLLVDQVNRQKQELMKMAMTDPLTSLNNRHALMQLVPKYIESSKRDETPLSVMIIDLDHFKNVNDTYGHDVGDIVLKAIGELLKNTCRGSDFVARFGGEEFVVLLSNCNKDNAMVKSENIRKRVEACRPNELTITASIGVTSMGDDTNIDFETLFKAADTAVYSSKENGRNQVTFNEP